MARLDLALVDRGLARSRSQAQHLIAEGVVRVNASPAGKPSQLVGENDHLAVVQPERYVSRAAYKLLGAWEDLDLEVAGRALDAGASTGGFTQVLLERGFESVIAVDVGHDQLSPEVRADPRVLVWERTNLRDLDLHHVEDQPVDLVVADVSFISLVLLLRPLTSVLKPDGVLVLMIKPQFEVGRELLGRGGVVRSPALHRQAIEQVLTAAAELGWHAERAAPSRLPGPAGNREFFVQLRRTAKAVPIDALLAAVVAERG